jgi:phytoene dehydrogenase-like protein
LVDILKAHGGELETNRPVARLEELPPSKLVLFDTHAHVMERVCGEALPSWYRVAVRAFRRGPGVFKLDYALSGPMPWLAKDCARAATVHLGGSMGELAKSEAAHADGRVPERPYVLVAQQSLFDATRAPAGRHTLWAYCHVPNGSTDDATPYIEAQLERFAPGFSKLVLARHAKGPAGFESTNASYLGGDISGGAVEGLQLFFRPVPGPPYVTPNRKILLCSSSTPPGPAVHGMCGYWAAQVALARLRAKG